METKQTFFLFLKMCSSLNTGNVSSKYIRGKVLRLIRIHPYMWQDILLNLNLSISYGLALTFCFDLNKYGIDTTPILNGCLLQMAVKELSAGNQSSVTNKTTRFLTMFFLKRMK